MSTAHWIQGDTRQVLAEMAAAGVVVDLVACSPPFLNLRSYLPADDPAKGLEIGSEAGPGEFIDTLLDVTEACESVLAPHGSLCIELGDTFAGSGGAGGDYADGGLRDGQPAFTGSARKARMNGEYPVRDDTPRPVRTRPDGNGKRLAGGQRLPDCTGDGWPADKSLSLITESYRWALAYGRNPFRSTRPLPSHRHPAWTYQRTTPRWRVRNVVRWVRPNPPVGRDGDKFRPATSDVVIACRTDEAGRRRYWDGDAVRTASDYERPNLAGKGSRPGGTPPGQRPNRSDHTVNPAGAPLLDWWKISPGGYEGAHYATFPPALVEPLVKAMCPQRVCTVCGEPSRRIVAADPSPYAGDSEPVAQARTGERRMAPVTGTTHMGVGRRAETVGWTECGHDAWRPGIILDPFAGSGTTLAVATGHGHTAIGIDLDARNVELARQRVGPMFFNETTVNELAEMLRPAKQGSAA